MSPRSGKVQIQVWLSEAERETIRKAARRDRRPMSQFILHAVSEYMARMPEGFAPSEGNGVWRKEK